MSNGYRPDYRVRPDYWTSANHKFVGTDSVRTGESAEADVWLLTPEAYPGCLREGDSIEVAEGSRVVARVVVLAVLNPILRS